MEIKIDPILELSSNYQTPVSSKTRKSYSLRETEFRKLTRSGASPYRILGGNANNKKKTRKTPLKQRLIKKNGKQIEQENLKKALSTQNDYSMELMAVSQDIVAESVVICSSENDVSTLTSLRQQLAGSVEKTTEKVTVAESIKKDIDAEKKESDSKIHQNISEIRVSPQIANGSTLTNSDGGYKKSSGGLNSVDSCWTDVDDKPQEKHRRSLRRESFIKSPATLASTVKRVEYQKRLYCQLSYTAPPNKYRLLADQIIRSYRSKQITATDLLSDRAKQKLREIESLDSRFSIL